MAEFSRPQPRPGIQARGLQDGIRKQIEAVANHSAPESCTETRRCALIEEVGFAFDSPPEEARFELSVPPKRKGRSEARHIGIARLQPGFERRRTCAQR